MSRILVVEPYKVLQYAFATALVADHEIRTAGNFPETVEDLDLVVVDGAAMRNLDLLGASELEAIRNWKVPVLWLDIDLGKDVPSLKDLHRAKLPLDKDALKQALAESTSPVLAPKAEPAPTDGPFEKEPSRSDSKNNRVADVAKQSVIDLVEVVQEDGGENVDQSPSFKKE